MTRSLKHLARTVYITMSKQEGEWCSTSAEGQLHWGRSHWRRCWFNGGGVRQSGRTGFFFFSFFYSLSFRASGTESRWNEIHIIIKYRINRCVYLLCEIGLVEAPSHLPTIPPWHSTEVLGWGSWFYRHTDQRTPPFTSFREANLFIGLIGVCKPS